MRALLNFDLAIEAEGDRYRARVVAAPAGEAEGSFALPFTDQDLQILVLKIIGSVGRSRRKLRRIESVERRLLEDFGGRLFQAVFAGEVRSCLERSLAAAERDDAGLRIRLRLAPPLRNIPWEYLYDREYGFLCLSPETPLVRYVAIPQPVRPFPVHPPLRILAMIAAPSDVQALQNEEEWDKLRTSLDELISRGMVELDRLPVGSLAALQRPLRQREYHVLHFVGHGLYDEEAKDGALVLEDESGHGRLVTGRDLGTMLRGHRSLRLVVLNACEGARSAVDDPFGGVAQALVRQGIPAVIAMQFEISDPAAVVFSQSFYQALADLLPADEAMVEARRAIFAASNEVEWATPVIYLRAPDGQIFASDPSGIADRQRHQEAERQRLEEERQREEEAERQRQEEAERQRREEEARRLEVGEWERTAAVAVEEERWSDAIAALERLVDLGENRPELLRRLQSARVLQHRAYLLAEINRLHAAGQWAAVLSTAEQLTALSTAEQLPDLGQTDAETAGLIASAKAELAELEISDHYELGLRQLDAKDWPAAARTFADIQARRPNYRQTAALLERSRANAEGRPTVASMRDRLLARIVDLSIYLTVLLLLTPTSSTSEQQLTAADTLRLGVIFLAIAVYEVVLTATWGRTLGKRLLRLRVVRAHDGGPAGWNDSSLRWFIQLLAWALCLGAPVLYLSPFWDKSGRRQGWHDRVAGTVVVKLPPR